MSRIRARSCRIICTTSEPFALIVGAKTRLRDRLSEVMLNVFQNSIEPRPCSRRISPEAYGGVEMGVHPEARQEGLRLSRRPRVVLLTRHSDAASCLRTTHRSASAKNELFPAAVVLFPDY